MGTLAALHYGSFRKGFVLGFSAVYLTWALTGMIYPTIWVYLILVTSFRVPMGWPILISTIYTGVATAIEVRFCDPVQMRHGDGGYPWHMAGDLGQALSV